LSKKGSRIPKYLQIHPVDAYNKTMHLLDLMAILSIALVATKLLGGLAAKIGIPPVIAELLVGVAIGNFGSEYVQKLQSSEILLGLSELGALFLLFIVGLETNLKEMAKVGVDAAASAFAGVAAPVLLGFIFIPFVANYELKHTLFMAAALSATSVGITARVLGDSKMLGSISGRIILGAAVIDDVLGIIVLASVSALVMQGHVTAGAMGLLLLKICAFVAGIALLKRILPRFLRGIKPLEVSGSVTILMLSLCLVSAWAAEKAGLAGIVGAFALGVALDDVHFKGYREAESLTLEGIMKPISDFLVPVFFIVMGMNVKLGALAERKSMMLAIVLTLCGIIGKLACGAAVRPKTVKAGADRLLIGLGMMPRGEVGLIFAAVGMKLGVLNNADYAAVVAMVAVTTLLAPYLMAWRARKI